MDLTLHQLLKEMTEKGGTDLHVTVAAPPTIRIDGALQPLRAFRFVHVLRPSLS